MKTYVYSFLSISGVARLILGVLFITGGVMHFTADATLHHSIFIDQLVATGYMWQFIGIVELISGILLLTPQYVVLGALCALPVTTNISLFHFHYYGLKTSALVMITLTLGMNLLIIWFYRSHISRLFINK